MVIDTIENLKNYVGMNPLFAEVVKYIAEHDLAAMEEGKHYIQDKDLFVNITTAKGKTPDEAVMETHVNMIDIQIPLDEEETYGYVPTPGCALYPAPAGGIQRGGHAALLYSIRRIAGACPPGAYH